MNPYRGLLSANAVSVLGTAMTLLALPWFVLATTGSAARTGTVAFCEGVPLFLASVLSGPLVDRLGARRTAVLSDVLSGAGIAAVPLLHATGALQFWQLCVLVGLVALVKAPGETARWVLMPALAEDAGTPVERAVSLYDGVSRAARMVGGPLAGVLVVAVGAANVLLLDAVSFLASAALVASFVPRSAQAAVEEDEAEPSAYLARLGDGLRFLQKDAVIRGLVLMVLVTNLLDAAWGAVLLPVYAREVLGSSVAQGLLVGVFGIGAVLGNIGYAWLGPRLPRWSLFTTAFLVCGPPRLLAMSVDVPLVGLAAVALLAGLAAGTLNPVLSTVNLERVPLGHRASVYGAASAGAVAGIPVGALVAGLVVEAVGVHAALAGAGLLYLAVTLTPVVRSGLYRQMDATRPARVAAGATMAA